MKIIEEGETKLMIPEIQTLSKKDKVFYNPVMEVNRDISVSVIQSFLNNFQRDEFLICDPLGGSGARGLRYANELKFKGDLKVVIGDINPNAVKLANENLKLNGKDNVEIFHEDANVLLSRNFRVFNVVDLDPFGSPAPYLDSAIRATITKNGVLCMTATDTAVLCGAYRKSCIRRYNAIPLRGDKELAVRILIGYAVRMASKYDIGLKPIFSHATDHYVRTFLITERGANRADDAIGELGYVKSINQEKIFRRYNESYEKGFGGPLYLGPINDPNIVKDALKVSIERNYSQRTINILETISKECELNQIGCYDIHEICSFIKKLAPPISDLMNNLKEKGFNVARVHYNLTGIKTDARLIDVIESIVEYNKS